MIAQVHSITIHLTAGFVRDCAGTFEPELMLEIAQRNGLENKLPFSNVEEARAAYQFHNLQSFLDIYYAGCAVLTTQQV